MAPAPPERASGNRSQRPSYGPSGMEDHPLTDGHLSAVLGAADADLLAFISILALSGMRPDELRRLRVAHCGHGVFQVGAHVENHGPREVPIHSALARTTIRLARGRAGDAFLIRDGAESGPAPSPCSGSSTPAWRPSERSGCRRPSTASGDGSSRSHWALGSHPISGRHRGRRCPPSWRAVETRAHLGPA
ncbi:MAG TPA: hypothetical protein VEX11_01595, partial [Acetobacteraceae bacterium]|nr:hypothetical protein [Acetobacteraceae bacterium]